MEGGEEEMTLGNIIEEAAIAIGIDDKGVQKGMKKVEGTMKKGLGNIMKSVIAPALAAFAGGQFATQIADEAVEVQRLARLTGMATEEFSAWANAANRAGVETDMLGDMLTDITDKASDFVRNDSGPFKELIEAGLVDTFTDANGALLSTEEIVGKIGNALNQLAPQEASGWAKRLGFNDPKVIAFFSQTRDEMRKSIEEARRFGVYTDQDAEMANEFSTALADMGRGIKSLLLPVFRILAPILTGAAKIVELITNHMWAFVPAIAAVGAILAKVFGGQAIAAGVKLLGMLSAPVLAVIAAITMLGLLLDDLVGWLNGDEAALDDFWSSIFGSREEALQTFENVKNVLVEVWEVLWQLGGIARTVLGVAIQIAFVIAQVVIGAFAGVVKAVVAFGTAVYDAVQGAINWLNELGDNIAGIPDAWDEAMGAIGAAWDGLCNRLKSIWDNTVGPLIDGLRNIGGKVQGFFSSEDKGIPAGGGATVDNSTHERTVNATVNVYGDVTQDTLRQVDAQQRRFANDVNGAV